MPCKLTTNAVEATYALQVDHNCPIVTIHILREELDGPYEVENTTEIKNKAKNKYIAQYHYLER